jgi:hypothetical protein
VDDVTVLVPAGVVMAEMDVVQMSPGEIAPEVLIATATAAVDQTPVAVAREASQMVTGNMPVPIRSLGRRRSKEEARAQRERNQILH